ncbi:hypothetical protein, partial [Salmonella enterica]|uniref:hypothetical protein n=1 Tax=Salmonella enterica TaxID=28901 RepID=UPI001117A7F3
SSDLPGNNLVLLDIYLDNGTKKYQSALDYSEMASCKDVGNCWSINEDGSQQYYSTQQKAKNDIIISDLTVWQDNVLEEDFKNIITSNRPASETVPG